MTALLFGVVLLCSIGSTSLSIYAGVLLANTDFKVAPGKINSVENCERACPVVGGLGCIHVPHVSIQWTVGETVFVATNFTAVAACSDCCQSMIGKDVDVRVDPQNFSIPLAVLLKGAQNPSLFYEIFYFILSLASTFLFLGCLVMITRSMLLPPQYNQID